jgi:hypothetical protein
MRWEVQDMTNMIIVKDNSTKYIVDIGALDALFSEDSNEV